MENLPEGLPGAAPLPAARPAVLEVRGLAYRFGTVEAVRGIDLRLEQGQIFGFLGRNGAGKTTTIRMIMGVIRPQAGTLQFFGGRAQKRTGTAEKRRIGYVSQAQHFYPWMTAARLGRFVGGLYPTWDAGEFARLLDGFEVPPGRPVAGLSGGTKAKLGLALALASRPELLILDEPMAGLDAVARREFLDLVQAQAASAGRTTFLSSHRIQEVERVCDRIGIIDHGRLVYDGTVADLRRQVREVRPATGFNDAAGLPPGFQLLDTQAGPDLRWIVRASPDRWESGALGEARVGDLGLEDIFIALVRTGSPFLVRSVAE